MVAPKKRTRHRIPPCPSPVPEFLNVQDLAGYLRRPPSRIYELVEHDALPHIKLGASLMFKRTDVDSYLETRKAKKKKAVAS